MDPLTHGFLPLTVAYALHRELFPDARYLLLGGVGLVPDLDKFLGRQGLFHALPTMVPLSLALLAAEYRLRGRLRYSVLAVAFLASHLLLDIVDGGPVPLLFPFVEAGTGLVYPATVTFGEGPVGVVVDGPLVALRRGAPRAGYRSFGFINGFGVASTLSFLAVWLGRRRDRRALAADGTGTGETGAADEIENEGEGESG